MMFKYGTTSGKSMTGKSKQFMISVYEHGELLYRMVAKDKNSMNKIIAFIENLAAKIGSEITIEKQKIYPNKYVGYINKSESCRLGQK